jgi:hypothetical protein
MIYFALKDGRHVVILTDEDLSRIDEGPIATQDKKVIVAYTPDAEWTAQQLKQLLGPHGRVILPAELDKILKDGLQRA